MQGIGIDAEIIGRVTQDVWPHVFTEEESFILSSSTTTESRTLATIIFCAKEAFYKCQYPITRLWIDFTDACVNVHDDGFTVRLLRIDADGFHGKREFRGRYVIHDDLVIAGITWPVNDYS
jgi:4'-phosphopantetheinyl transferase EntD